jgi:hypothetical protein
MAGYVVWYSRPDRDWLPVSSVGVLGRARGVRTAFAVLAVGVGVLVTVSGCATKGIPYKRPSSDATPSASATAPTSAAPVPTASMTPLAAAAGQLTGTDLESVLLPASFFPAGFTAPSTGPVTSGGSLISAAATNNLATMSCSVFLERLGGTGFGETALAAVSLSGSGQVFGELVYQFASAPEATAFVAAIKSLAGRCGSFKVTGNGQTGTYSLTAADGAAIGGHPTLALGETGSTAGTKLVVNTLFSASGVDVFSSSAAGVDAGAPAVPAAETIIYNLMKRQAAAAVLG